MLQTAASLSAEILSLKEEKGWTWKEFAFHVNLVLGEKCPSETSLFRYAKGISTPTEEIEQIIYQAIHAIRNSQSTADELVSSDKDNRQPVETSQLNGAAPEEAVTEQTSDADSALTESLAAQVAEFLTTYKEETGQTWVQIAAQVKSAFVGKAPSGSTLFRYSKSYTIPPVDIAQSLLTALGKLQNIKSVEAVAVVEPQDVAPEAAPEIAAVAVAEAEIAEPLHEESLGSSETTIAQAPIEESSIAESGVSEAQIEEFSVGEAVVSNEVSDEHEAIFDAAAEESQAEQALIVTAGITEREIEEFFVAADVTQEEIEEASHWGPYNEFFELPEALFDEEPGDAVIQDFSDAVIAQTLNPQPEPVFEEAVVIAQTLEPASVIIEPVNESSVETAQSAVVAEISDEAFVSLIEQDSPAQAVLNEVAEAPENAASATQETSPIAEAVSPEDNAAEAVVSEKAAPAAKNQSIALADALMNFKRDTGLSWKEIAEKLDGVVVGHVPSRAMLFQYARGLIAPTADVTSSIIEAIGKIQGISQQPVVEAGAVIIDEPSAAVVAETLLEPIAAIENLAVTEVAAEMAEPVQESAAEAVAELENQVDANVTESIAVITPEISVTDSEPISQLESPVAVDEDSQLADSFGDFVAIYEQWAAEQQAQPVAELFVAEPVDEVPAIAEPVSEVAEIASPELNGAAVIIDHAELTQSEEFEDPIISMIREYKMALPSRIEPRLPDLSSPIELSANGNGYQPEHDEYVMFCRSRDIFFSQIPEESVN